MKNFINHCLIALRLRMDFYRLKHLYGKSKQLKIQFGCGFNVVPGWVNVDLVPGRKGVFALDARKRLPLSPNPQPLFSVSILSSISPSRRAFSS